MSHCYHHAHLQMSDFRFRFILLSRLIINFGMCLQKHLDRPNMYSHSKLRCRLMKFILESPNFEKVSFCLQNVGFKIHFHLRFKTMYSYKPPTGVTGWNLPPAETSRGKQVPSLNLPMGSYGLGLNFPPMKIGLPPREISA